MQSGIDPIVAFDPPTQEPESCESSDQELDDQERAELDSAIEEHTQAIALDPQDADAYNARGLAYRDKGDLDQAIADYEQAIALGPALAEAWNNRGEAYSDKGDRDQAIADLEVALELGLSPDLKQQAEELLEELGR